MLYSTLNDEEPISFSAPPGSLLPTASIVTSTVATAVLPEREFAATPAAAPTPAKIGATGAVNGNADAAYPVVVK
jgi:hypothetical protein